MISLIQQFPYFCVGEPKGVSFEFAGTHNFQKVTIYSPSIGVALVFSIYVLVVLTL